MNEGATLVLSGVAGLFLGAIFFGGLWWSVRQGVASPRPALWFIGSTLLRLSIILVGFYFVGRGRWSRMLVCLLGFVTARFIVICFTRPPVERPNSPAKEASHAP